MWVNETELVRTILKEKNKIGGIVLPNVKNDSNPATVIQTVWT